MSTTQFTCCKCAGTGEGRGDGFCIYCDGFGVVFREVEGTEEKMLRGARLARETAARAGRRVKRTALPDNLIARI